MQTENSSTVTARTLVAALVANGIRAVAYCPGSRNAPFAYALAQAEAAGDLQVATFSDERGAGFWAIGFMKGSPSTPCAVVTTSGTAVAELRAAAEEAFHQELPLVLITADRPHHMRSVGASQTTLQEGIFTSSVVASAAIPAGVTNEPSETGAVLTRLILRSLTEPGPVHLNVAFDDPLVPEAAGPLPDVSTPKLLRFPEPYPTWEDVVERGLRTVVVAGDRSDPAVLQAAAERAVPILAEPSAGLVGATTWIPHAPPLLKIPELRGRIQQVVVTGHPTLSRPVTALLASRKTRKIVCSSKRIYPDVSGTAAVITRGLENTVPSREPSEDERAWLDLWERAAGAAESAIHGLTDQNLNLVGAARSIWKSREGTALWLSASNAIRGFDVGASGTLRGDVYANRGLAGIDGTVASALGLAGALRGPVRAVIGDMAFAVDLSTLVQRTGLNENLQLLVLNDGGGSIFASLEHGAAPESLYEKYFAVPPKMDAANLAKGAGWDYSAVRSPEELGAVLGLPVMGLSVVELFIPRPDGLLKQIDVQVRESLR